MTQQLARYQSALKALKALIDAEKQSLRCAEACGQIEPGSSRARITTANARWSTAAEHRDRMFHEAHCTVVEAGLAEPFPDDYYGTSQTGHAWGAFEIVRRKPGAA
jgi:hypothetical protein